MEAEIDTDFIARVLAAQLLEESELMDTGIRFNASKYKIDEFEWYSKIRGDVYDELKEKKNRIYIWGHDVDLGTIVIHKEAGSASRYVVLGKWLDEKDEDWGTKYLLYVSSLEEFADKYIK